MGGWNPIEWVEDVIDIITDVIDIIVDIIEDVISWIIPMPEIPDFGETDPIPIPLPDNSQDLSINISDGAGFSTYSDCFPEAALEDLPIEYLNDILDLENYTDIPLFKIKFLISSLITK